MNEQQQHYVGRKESSVETSPGFLEVLGAVCRGDESIQVQVKWRGDHEVVVVEEEASIEHGGRDGGCR